MGGRVNGETRELIRKLRDQHVRESVAWERHCVGCGEPLPSNATTSRKFCSKECNGKFYWKATRAKRVDELLLAGGLTLDGAE